MTRRRADHLRLVAINAEPPPTDRLAALYRKIDAIAAAEPRPRDFTIGALARIEPWQRPTWRAFHGVVWRQPPSLLDRLQHWWATRHG